MPDIEFRLTAIDEATPVIDRARQKMNDFNRSQATASPKGTASYGQMESYVKQKREMERQAKVISEYNRDMGFAPPQAPQAPGKKNAGGVGGALGGGIIKGAGITIIAQAALQALQKIWKVLNEASPYLASISQQFKTAMNIYLRPLGDSLAKALAPKSEYALKVAEERADAISKIDEEFGVAGAALATFGFVLYDVKMALWDFNYGVWDTLSKVYLWPMDKLGDLLGVDLPGSLTELLDTVFGIKGGFSGVQDWLEGVPGSLVEGFTAVGQEMRDVAMRLVTAIADLGVWLWDMITRFVGDPLGTLAGFSPWLWDKITRFVGDPLGTLADLGSWLWNKITSLISNPMGTLAGFSSWLYNKLKDVLGGIPADAYKAFHNAIASLLNSISNIELPLVGKPFKGLFGTIPMLASGGIVTQPTLAMIGERGAEAVIPLNKAGQFGMGQGQQVTINLNAPIYGVNDLESAIDSALRRSRMGFATYG